MVDFVFCIKMSCGPIHKKNCDITNLNFSIKSEKDDTVSYDEIKQKVITQANDYHRVKAYTP